MITGMNRMKIAVLGSAGQLGRDLGPRLTGEVFPLTREQIDLAQPATIRPALEQIRPDVVVNCAAYNFVDKAESEPEAAFAVNAWGVRELAMACRDLGCVLVQFSSDYVFGLDTARESPYAETDAPGPVSVYGLSKLAGEYLVRSICPRHFVIRTCGLYGVWGAGGKGGNFVETMLRVAAQGKPLRVVADQVCTPSYTVDVATATAALISSERFGLYHIVNGGSCTWHGFAAAIFEMAGVHANPTAITSAEYGAPARRPGYGVLATEKYHTVGPAMRPWREALAAYLEERKKAGVKASGS
jgi:dTDP-4-dehydrorhamnose reductase